MDSDQMESYLQNDLNKNELFTSNTYVEGSSQVTVNME